MGYTEKDIQKLIDQSVSPWLIKSSGRIVGPFSKEEIEEKLRTRELVPLDEVSKPTGRWRYLRDDPVFRKTVESVKSDLNSDNEQTMTSTVEGGGEEFTRTVEMDSEYTMTESITEDIIGDHGSQRRKPKGGKEDFADVSAISSYGYSEDKNIESELNQTSKIGWMVTLMVMGIVAWVVYSSRSTDPDAPAGGLSTSIEQGLAAYHTGNFDESIRYLRKALALDPKNIEVVLKLTPMILQREKDYVYSRKILEDVLNYQTEKRYLLDANVTLGLSHLLENRTGEAAIYLQAAAKFDELYQPLLVNQAAYYFAVENYDRVIQNYERARIHDDVDGALVMLGVRAFLKKFQGQLSRTDLLGKAKAAIDEHLQRSSDYRQEFLLARAYVQGVHEGHPSSVDVHEILNTDPFLTDEHWHDPQIYRNHMNWGVLFFWCEELYSRSNKSAAYEGLLGLCLLKAQRELEAAKVIENALEKDPNDAVLLGLKSYQLLRSHDESKALGILTHVLPGQFSKLSLALMGRFCGQPPQEQCAFEYWQKLLREDPRNISALGGMAQLYMQKGQEAKAKEVVKAGMALAPDYLPFIRVRYETEGTWETPQ